MWDSWVRPGASGWRVNALWHFSVLVVGNDWHVAKWWTAFYTVNERPGSAHFRWQMYERTSTTLRKATRPKYGWIFEEKNNWSQHLRLTLVPWQACLIHSVLQNRAEGSKNRKYVGWDTVLYRCKMQQLSDSHMLNTILALLPRNACMWLKMTAIYQLHGLITEHVISSSAADRFLWTLQVFRLPQVYVKVTAKCQGNVRRGLCWANTQREGDIFREALLDCVTIRRTLGGNLRCGGEGTRSQREMKGGPEWDWQSLWQP